MNRPAAADLTFDTRFKTLAAEFLNQRRRQKRRNNGEPFVRSERINTLADSRKRLDAFRQDWTDIQCFELARYHTYHSSQRFRRSPESITSINDHTIAIAINQTLACAIHQPASGVLFAASAGICWRANNALMRNESSGLNISNATHKSGTF